MAFASFGSGSGGFGSFSGSQSSNLDSPDGLLQLAQQQGGSVAAAADSLVHPQTSILSTIGDGFKHAFGDFVDLISAPSQIVAGGLNSLKTGQDLGSSVADALKNNISPADVLFGKENPNDNGMEKVGSFLVRTAANVLLDPLTYVTFGQVSGILGFGAATEVALGENATAHIIESGSGAAVKAGEENMAALTKPGQQTYNWLKGLQAQIEGKTVTEIAKTGDAALDFAGEDLKRLVNSTLDAPLNPDFAKKAISNMLEQFPQLTETYVNKGGIKFFGKTLLSGQRISTITHMIPGMTQVDNITAPIRAAIMAPFSTKMIFAEGKDGESMWQRLPEEYLDLRQAGRDLGASFAGKKVGDIQDIIEANGLNITQANFLTASAEAGKIPAEKSLANAWNQFFNLSENSYKELKAAGHPVSYLENYTPHMQVKIKTNSMPYKPTPSTAVGAALHRKLQGPIFNSGEAAMPEGLDSLANEARASSNSDQFTSNVLSSDVESKFGGIPQVKDLIEAHGKGIVGDYIQKIQDEGHSLDRATSFGAKRIASGTAPKEVVDALKRFGFETSETKAIKPQNLKYVLNKPNSSAFSSLGDFFQKAVKPTGDKLPDVEKAITEGRNADADAMLKDMTRQGFEIFDPNLATAWIGRSLDNVRATTAKYFMDQLAKNFGEVAENAPKNYRAINSASIKGASEDYLNRVFGEGGATIVYHPAIAKDVEGFLGNVINDDAMGQIGKGFDKLQNFWKASVTSYFPAFHGRNAISNVLQNFMDMGVHALNPMLAFQAGKLQNDARVAQKLTIAAMRPGAGEAEAKALADHLSQTVFTDTTGNTWSLGEMLNTVRDHNIALTRQSGVTSADIAEGPEALARGGSLFPETTLKGKAKNVLGTPQRITQEMIGGSIEDHARLMNFMGNLRNTGDVTLAAKRTKQFLFDYGNLTNFEKTVMKRLLPFYTYTRKNIELQAKTLLSAPGKVAAEVTGLQTLGQVISGGQTLSKQEQDALPDWLQSGMGILTQKQGEVVTMLNSLGTPIEQPFSALQPNQLLGSLSPLIRLPFETMSGYSLFQGKMLSDVTNAAAFAKAPDVLKSLIGFTTVNGKKSNGQPYTLYVSLNPKMMNLILNLPPFSRVFTAVKQIQAQDTASQTVAVQQLLGVKPYTVDLVQEQQKQQDAMKTQLQNLLTKAGVTAQFQTTYIPKGK